MHRKYVRNILPTLPKTIFFRFSAFHAIHIIMRLCQTNQLHCTILPFRMHTKFFRPLANAILCWSKEYTILGMDSCANTTLSRFGIFHSSTGFDIFASNAFKYTYTLAWIGTCIFTIALWSDHNSTVILKTSRSFQAPSYFWNIYKFHWNLKR